MLTGISLWLHVQNLFYAGGLWRDEVDSVNTGLLPDVADVFRCLPYDSFPACWLFALRTWLGLGLTSDFMIRLSGLLMGVGLLMAVWMVARLMNRSVPLLALALIGFNSAIIQWGDSIRAWGLGMVLIVLTFVAIWRLSQSATLFNTICAAVLAFFAAHTTYYNCILLFAIGVAGAMVAWRDGVKKRAALIFGIDIAVAISMSIYIPVIREVKSWHLYEAPGLSFGWYLDQLTKTLESSGHFLTAVWTGLLALALIWTYTIQKKRTAANTKDCDKALFVLTGCVVAIPTYALFLKNLKYATNEWYYIAFLSFLALAIETGLAPLFHRNTARVARLLLVVMIAGLGFPAAWKVTRTRFTSMDLTAQTLQSNATREDFIVVTKWYCGISFDRYFRGTTPWATVPVLEDHKFHRFDLVKAQMALPDQTTVVQPIIESIKRTLKSGHRVWLVGSLHFLQPGEKPFIAPPAPQLPSGWYGEPYERSWSMQLADFVQTHAERVEVFSIREGRLVSEFENPPLITVDGWRGD